MSPVAHARGGDENAESMPFGASLARQTSSLADSGDLSKAKKERLIAQAVRSAVVASTSRISDENQRLNAAGELARAAVSGAPAYKNAILRAAAFAPGISSIPGASNSIASAMARPKTPVSTARVSEDAAPVRKPLPARRQTAARPRVEAPVEEDEAPPYSSYEEDPTPPRPRKRLVSDEQSPPRRMPNSKKPKLDQTSRIRFMLDSQASYDNNVYLTKDNKVSDTTVSIRPGFSIESADNSRLTANIGTRVAFTHALDHTSENQTLVSGEGGLKYDGTRVRTNLGITFDQSNQNSRDVVIAGKRQVFRTDSFGANSNFEYQFTGKSSGGIGLNYSSVRYPNATLTNNHSWDVPVNYYYAVTPKSDLSSGVSFRQTTASGSSDRSRSVYYNVGARGDFTQNLSGKVSVGYSRSSSTRGSTDGTLAFNGSLTLAVGAKSSLSLGASRDFQTSAQGQVLKNGTYSIGFSNQTTLFWQNSVHLSYQTIDYGAAVFTPTAVYPGRNDKYLEVGASTNYTWNSWLLTGLSLSYRKNASSNPGVEFDGMLLNLLVGAHY